MMSAGINSHLISSSLEMESELQLNSLMTSHTMVGKKSTNVKDLSKLRHIQVVTDGVNTKGFSVE